MYSIVKRGLNRYNTAQSARYGSRANEWAHDKGRETIFARTDIHLCVYVFHNRCIVHHILYKVKFLKKTFWDECT